MFWLICLGGAILGAVSSQSLLDSFIVLAFFGLCYLSWKKKSLSVFQASFLKIEWAFAAYVVVTAISLWLNKAEFSPLAKFVWIINFYLFVLVFRQSRLQRQSLLKYLSIAFLLPSLYALIGYVHGADLLTGRSNERITGLLNSSTYHAHGNAIIFVFFAALLLTGWSRLKNFWRVFGCIALIILGLSILLTFTRGIWLSIAVSSLVMLSYYRFRLAVRLGVVGVLVLGSAYFAWPKFSQRVDTLFQAHGGDPVRTHLLKINWQMFVEHPWLGIGAGENVRRSEEYWFRPAMNPPKGWQFLQSHAHNQYMNVLSTAGTLGFIFFLSFFVFFFVKNLKLMRGSAHQKESFRFALLFACLWVQLEFALACLTDVGFEYAKIRALLLFTWALVVALERYPKMAVEEDK